LATAHSKEVRMIAERSGFAKARHVIFPRLGARFR